MSLGLNWLKEITFNTLHHELTGILVLQVVPIGVHRVICYNLLGVVICRLCFLGSLLLIQQVHCQED